MVSFTATWDGLSLAHRLVGAGIGHVGAGAQVARGLRDALDNDGLTRSHRHPIEPLRHRKPRVGGGLGAVPRDDPDLLWADVVEAHPAVTAHTADGGRGPLSLRFTGFGPRKSAPERVEEIGIWQKS